MKRVLPALISSALLTGVAYAQSPAPYVPSFTNSKQCQDWLRTTHGLTPEKEKKLVAEDSFVIAGHVYVMRDYGGHIARVCDAATSALVLSLSRKLNAADAEVSNAGSLLRGTNERLGALQNSSEYKYRYVGWIGTAILILYLFFRLLRIFFREDPGVRPETRAISNESNRLSRSANGHPRFIDPNPPEEVRA